MNKPYMTKAQLRAARLLSIIFSDTPLQAAHVKPYFDKLPSDCKAPAMQLLAILTSQTEQDHFKARIAAFNEANKLPGDTHAKEKSPR